uniref:Putative homing endonuclease n=1 Tax=viral metagenome TaxID=1070528 RepID=A0A6H1ZSB2_9ZZZZ
MIMNRLKTYYAKRWQVLERDNFTCQYCGQYAPNVALEVDHVTPREDGGSDDVDNLKTSCFACNRGKSGFRIQLKRKGIPNGRGYFGKPETETGYYKIANLEGVINARSVALSLGINLPAARMALSRTFEKGKIKRVSRGHYQKL